MNNGDTDMDSTITTFNTAVTETASKILGQHRQRKQIPWVIAGILDLCDKKREKRKKRFELKDLRNTSNNSTVTITTTNNMSNNTVTITMWASLKHFSLVEHVGQHK